ncbi:MAG TPA: DUF1080 domain-containing protein [Polyangiaceae bacterium]|nr:DUF1080 domain-containing protein [Polyangiaceae bacterium]
MNGYRRRVGALALCTLGVFACSSGLEAPPDGVKSGTSGSFGNPGVGGSVSQGGSAPAVNGGSANAVGGSSTSTGGASGGDASAGATSGGAATAMGGASMGAGSGGSAAAGAAGASTAGSGGTGGIAAGGAAGSAPTAGASSGGAAGAAGGSGGGAAGAGGSDGKIVLFDGKNFDEWQPLTGTGPVAWRLVAADASMEVVPNAGNIRTKRTFQNVFVHAEFKTPMLPANVTGQARGNSGIFLKGMYEMQVLDSFGRQPEIDGAGAVYGVKAPLVNASTTYEIWQTYEIEFKAPTYDASGRKLTQARILSATLNGQVVQTNTDVPNTTASGQPEAPGPGPLMLQDHKNQLWFRNIWVIPRP